MPRLHHPEEVEAQVPTLHRALVVALTELVIEVAPSASDVAGQPALERRQAVRKTLVSGQAWTSPDEVAVRVEPQASLAPVAVLSIQLRVRVPSPFDDGPR